MRILSLAVCLAIAWPALAAPPPKKAPAQSPAKLPQSRPSQPHGDPYSITVPVDATAASASVAQNNAINGGRMKAWAQISHRLVPQKDWSKLPALDASGIERVIRGYSVSDERRSTTRYIAKVTYIFNPGAIKHLLRTVNIGVAEEQGSAILLVAMAPTYNAHSAWAHAVAQPKSGTAQFSLVTPIGDAVDQSSLGPLHFSDAGWGAVQPVASRVHAGEAVLIEASNPAASKMHVRLRQIGPGKPVVIPDVDIPVSPGTSPEAAYANAAEQAEAAIEDALKNRGTVEVSKKSKMVAAARFTSLAQWSSMLAKIQALPVVSDVDVIAIDTGEARVSVAYSGSAEQLRTAAGQSNLNLSERDGFWWISSGKPAGEDTGASE